MTELEPHPGLNFPDTCANKIPGVGWLAVRWLVLLKLVGVELLSLLTERDGSNLSHRAEIRKIQATPRHTDKLKAPMESTQGGLQAAEFDLKKK